MNRPRGKGGRAPLSGIATHGALAGTLYIDEGFG
jgi:hypothetical protein